MKQGKKAPLAALLEVKTEQSLDKRHIKKSNELQQQLVQDTVRKYPSLTNEEVEAALQKWLT